MAAVKGLTAESFTRSIVDQLRLQLEQYMRDYGETTFEYLLTCYLRTAVVGLIAKLRGQEVDCSEHRQAPKSIAATIEWGLSSIDDICHQHGLTREDIASALEVSGLERVAVLAQESMT